MDVCLFQTSLLSTLDTWWKCCPAGGVRPCQSLFAYAVRLTIPSYAWKERALCSWTCQNCKCIYLPAPPGKSQSILFAVSQLLLHIILLHSSKVHTNHSHICLAQQTLHHQLSVSAGMFSAVKCVGWVVLSGDTSAFFWLLSPRYISSFSTFLYRYVGSESY